MFDIQRQPLRDEREALDDRDSKPRSVPGKRTLVEQFYPGFVQRFATDLAVAPEDPAQVHAAASRGLATPAGALPYASSIQRAFGRHDISGVLAHTGTDAASSARAMGADAFAAGNHVVLGRGTDLFTVAHEAAHVVQQRGGVQLKGGVGAAHDEYEQHADAVAAAVVRGESAEALLDRYAGGGAGAGGAVQRKGTAVGLLKDMAGSSMTKEVLWALLATHGLQASGEMIERVLCYVADNAFGPTLLELISTAGLQAATQALLGYLGPFVAAMRYTLSLVSMVPPSLRSLIAYGVGRSLVTVLTWCRMSVAAAEEWANTVLVGTDLAASLAYAIKLLDDLTQRPISTIYKLAWSWAAPKLGSDAPTGGSAIAEGIGEGLGLLQDTPTSERPESEQPVEALSKSLVKQDLKYIWLEIDEPEIQRFSKQEKENQRPSGGLVLPFNVGLDLFGVRLDSATGHQVQLPWSGGFNVALRDLAITGVPALNPVFSVGKILLPHVDVSNEGLDSFSVAIYDLSFANRTAVMPLVTASWTRGEGLVFTGKLDVTIFDTLIKGSGKLELDDNGGFERAELGVAVPSSFTIIPGVLSLANPTFAGSITKDKTITMRLGTDIKAASKPGILPGAQLEVTNAYVGWTGERFEGGMDSFLLRLGDHVELKALKAHADRERITVAQASLVYRHDPAQADRAKGELSTIGGIDPALLSFTGLKDLVIGGMVTDLRIGKRIEVARTEVSLPSQERGEQSQESPQQEPPLVDREYLGIGSAKPILSKIGASLFGVTAMLDIENRSGTVEGEVTYKPDLPTNFSFHYPIVPGLDASAGIQADITLGANIKAGATVPKADRFEVHGTAGVLAKLGVELQAGVTVGSGWLAGISALLFARAEAAAEAKTTIAGTLVLDREARTLRPSTEEGERPTITYDAGAKLTASIGAKVEATALVFFKKELWRYTFKEWTLGEYRVAGAVHSGDNGEPQVARPTTAGFGGTDGGLPLPPEVANEKLDDVKAELMKPQAIHDSAEERKALITKLALEAEGPTYQRLQEALLSRTEQVHDNIHWNLETALSSGKDGKGGLLTREQEREAEQRSRSTVLREFALENAAEAYKLVLLLLVDAKSASASVLDEGKIDIAKIEERIREAAERAELALGGT